MLLSQVRVQYYCPHRVVEAHTDQVLTGVLFVVTPALALPPGFSSSRPIASPSLWPREFDALTARAQSCAETCGSTCYYQTTIDAAVAKGYSLFQSGKTLGSDKYPHEYNDYEGFDFSVEGPWYEFPILNTFKVYAGGSPGADRVIFNEDGDYAGVITHNGASGDDFVACAGVDP